jgi:hypothetical protein
MAMDSVFTSPTLVSIVRQWPIATNIAQNLSVGSLITLARTSSSLRAALHGLEYSVDYEADVSGEKPTVGKSDECGKGVRPRKMVQPGDHRTPYWEGLKRVAQFTCSSKTHTKGDKTRSCLYCSIPICESCVVKHSFGKNENTFKNRCRFMCQRCWDAGNRQKEFRYTGKRDAPERDPHKFAGEARRLCECTGKDGWVCNDCKEKQNTSMRVNGSDVCFGQDCEMKLEDDKDRRKICLWCDNPVPRGRPSIRSSLAFDQKLMMDAKEFLIYTEEREREPCLTKAQAEYYENNVHRPSPMLLSRRDMRGNHAVKDDPDADVQQYLRNLEVFNYQQFAWERPSGDEIYDSKLGKWRYSSDFLRCFMKRCTKHRDVAFLKTVTSLDPRDAPYSKTNMDLWMMKASWTLDELAEVGGFTESLETEFGAFLESEPARTETGDWGEEQTLADEQTLAEERTLAGEETPCEERTVDKTVSRPRSKGSKVREEDQDGDGEFTIIHDDETSEAREATAGPAYHDEQSFEPSPGEIQPEEQPPEYGADTLVLETGDALGSN